jgi:hypothetical protein
MTLYKLTHINSLVSKDQVPKAPSVQQVGGIINIAGVIGLTVLLNEKTNNKVFLFYDDHENMNYCPNSQHFINELLESLIGNSNEYMLILEEPFVENYDKIQVLWDNVTHLCLFRDFYSKIIKKCSKDSICNGFPVDIRLVLIDISPYLDDYSNVNITLPDYFKKISYLFDVTSGPSVCVGGMHGTVGAVGIPGMPGMVSNIGILTFLKKVFSSYTHTFHYKQLKKKVDAFYQEFIKDNMHSRLCDLSDNREMNYVCKYPFTEDAINNFFDEMDKLLSAIMEFYMIILINIFKNKKKIVYAGYYHCNNLKHILLSYYGYKEIYNTGITEQIETSDNVKSCISVPKELFLPFVSMN